MNDKLSHLDDGDRPRMVDVSEKPISRREALARATVHLPEAVVAVFDGDDLQTKKGSVFQTARIAGVAGAKQTAQLIPFCHPLGLDRCDVDLRREGARVVIECRVVTHARTGVEMEALTGASVAALTVYDMCKALSHDIVIEAVELVSKTGGRSGDVRREPAHGGGD